MRERVWGGVPIQRGDRPQTRDRHCVTLGIYVLCGVWALGNVAGGVEYYWSPYSAAGFYALNVTSDSEPWTN